MKKNFCRNCQELVFSTFCPGCGSPPGDLDHDDDTESRSHEVEVDECSSWGSEFSEDRLTILSYDDCFGTDVDD